MGFGVLGQTGQTAVSLVVMAHSPELGLVLALITEGHHAKVQLMKLKSATPRIVQVGCGVCSMYFVDSPSA